MKQGQVTLAPVFILAGRYIPMAGVYLPAGDYLTPGWVLCVLYAIGSPLPAGVAAVDEIAAAGQR